MKHEIDDEINYTIADLIEELERFDDTTQVRFGRYEYMRGYYRIELLCVSEMFVRERGGQFQSCDEGESEEAFGDGEARQIVVIT